MDWFLFDKGLRHERVYHFPDIQSYHFGHIESKSTKLQSQEAHSESSQTSKERMSKRMF